MKESDKALIIGLLFLILANVCKIEFFEIAFRIVALWCGIDYIILSSKKDKTHDN